MLLKLSISGGILIFFITILRFFSINKLPKKVFMLLWDITLLRLLLPFNLPLNSIFIFNIAGISDSSSSLTRIYTTSAMQTGTNEMMPDGTVCSYLCNIKLIPAIWAVGMVFFLFSFGILYYKEYQKIRMFLPISKETADNLRTLADIPERVYIYVSDRIHTPLTLGILSPKIVLPKFLELDNDTELKYVLTHEAVHIKRADNLRKIIMLIAAGIHWFNPFVWIMYVFYNRDIELSCDEKVINLLGQRCKKEYAMTLVNLAEKQSNWPLFSSGFGKSAIHERIVAIMKFKKISATSIICAVALAGMAITAFVQNNTETAGKSKSLDAGTDPVYVAAHSKYFTEYEEYGLSYDPSGNHIMLGKEIVGYFHDETSKGTYTHITDSAGTVGIIVSRDSKYKIKNLIITETPEDGVIYETNETGTTDKMQKMYEQSVNEYGYPVDTYSYSLDNGSKKSQKQGKHK